jgi:hypothetical protein
VVEIMKTLRTVVWGLLVAAMIAGCDGDPNGAPDADLAPDRDAVGIDVPRADAGDAGGCPQPSTLSCTALVEQCQVQAGELVCPCSDNPWFNDVVACLKEMGGSTDPGNPGLECWCFTQYRACANESSTNGDAGFASSFDGCGI